jgi:hypothetical protein
VGTANATPAVLLLLAAAVLLQQHWTMAIDGSLTPGFCISGLIGAYLVSEIFC